MDRAPVRGCAGVPRAPGRPHRLARAPPWTRETRCSTSLAGTAASASCSSSAGCVTGASISRRRWWRKPGAGSAIGPRSTSGDLNDYVPPEPVAATTVFRAIYYARDRAAFFRQAAEYTRKKLVFDLNPRQYSVDDVLADLRAAGLARIDLRPFFVPQTVALPGPVGRAREGARAHRPARRGSRSASASRISSRLAGVDRLELDRHRRAELDAARCSWDRRRSAVPSARSSPRRATAGSACRGQSPWWCTR